MLEIKLKDIIEKNMIDEQEGIQFWQNKNGSRLITTITGDDKVCVYYLNDNPRAWVEDTFAAFEKTIIGELEFRECDSNWEHKDYKEVIELIHLKGINYWKNKDGVLYMTMWNRLHGIEATLIPMNIATSGPVVYPRPVDMLTEMKRLNLYKVHNMRLEEF